MADTPPKDPAATDPVGQPVADDATPVTPAPATAHAAPQATAGWIHQPPVPPGGRGPGARWPGRGPLPLLLAGLVGLLIGCAFGGTVVAAFAVVAAHHRHPGYHHEYRDDRPRPGWYDNGPRAPQPRNS